MTIIVSIHQPNQKLFDMFDNIYVLAKGGANVYSGHPMDIDKYFSSSSNNCGVEIAIEVLLKYCHNFKQDSGGELNLHIQTKTELARIIDEEGLIEYGKFSSTHKEFSLINLWNLIKRTMKHSYSVQWKNLVMQFISYLTFGILMRFGFKSEIIKPDGCVDKIFLDFYDNCNSTNEYLFDDHILRVNFKFIYMITISIPLIMIVFIIVPFVNELKVIQNEYNNCKRIFHEVFIRIN